MRADRLRWETLARWAAVAAVVELVVLRLATRTIINIPGLDLLSGPLSVVGRLGRLAYFSALVLVVATFVGLVRRARPPAAMAVGVLALVAAGAGDWLSLVAVALVALLAVGDGWRGLPLVLIAGAFLVNGLAQVAQGAGGGIDGATFAGLITVAEVLALIGLVLSPLLIGERPFRRVVWAGTAVALVVMALMAVASSMTSILVLWSFGLSGSLPLWAYGLAAGVVTVTLVTAVQIRRPVLVTAVLLIVAGGFSLASTYQTALLVAGLTIATLPQRSTPPKQPAGEREPRLELVL